MANVSRPGFWPIRHRGNGTIINRRARVLTNNTTAIFFGDAVAAVSTGDVVVASVANTAVASVAQGVSYINAAKQRISAKYLPAATLYTGTAYDADDASWCYVVDQPADVDFEAQVDEAMTFADFQQNFAMVLTAGSTTTGMSGHVLDYTGHNTTATLPWRVRDFIERSDNDYTAANAKVSCTINAGMTEPDISAYTGL